MSGIPIDPPAEFLKELIDITHELPNWRFRKEREGLYVLDDIGNFGSDFARKQLFLRFEASSTPPKFDVYCYTSNLYSGLVGVILATLMIFTIGIVLTLSGELWGIFLILFSPFLLILERLTQKHGKENIHQILKWISTYPGFTFHANATYERVLTKNSYGTSAKQFVDTPRIDVKNRWKTCPNCGTPNLDLTEIYCKYCGVLLIKSN